MAEKPKQSPEDAPLVPAFSGDYLVSLRARLESIDPDADNISDELWKKIGEKMADTEARVSISTDAQLEELHAQLV